MAMSLRRSGNTEYRKYVRSQAWGWRRTRWFRDCRRRGTEPACQVCGARLDQNGTLDLHHVSYDGVKQEPDGTWIAGEKDEDLLPLCREHHERLHKILDGHGRDYYGWNRRRASVVILARLKAEHTRNVNDMT